MHLKSILILTFLLSGLSSAQAAFLTAPIVSLHYWNDNLIISDLGSLQIPEGNDDHLTTNFLLAVSWQSAVGRLGSELCLNIVTHKQAGWRTDLLSCSISLTQNPGWGVVNGNIGLLTKGQFAGDQIQNRYHQQINFPVVNLPYDPRPQVGLILSLNASTSLYEGSCYRIRGWSAGQLRTALIPSSVRLGSDLNFNPVLFLTRSFLQFGVQSSYGYYVPSSFLLDDLFRPGLTWGSQLTLGRIESLAVSVWFTTNRYGVHQPHFGLTIAYPGRENLTSYQAGQMFP